MSCNFPLVSVIVPNYNHAIYLEQRLETVFNQTYQNFEVIILDDKSTDHSLEIINKYRNNPHVSQIVVNDKNSGSPFKQWDRGINLAHGELIWIAESDDYNDITFLETILLEWKRHKDVVVAYSLYVPFFENQFIRYKEHKNQCFDGKSFAKNRMARYCCVRNASGAIFRRSVYNAIDKEFLTFKSSGDYMFWSSIMQYGNVLKVNKNLTFWRKSSISVSGTSESKGIIAFEDKKVFDFIDCTYQLNAWQRMMAYAIKLDYFSKYQYDSFHIRNKIYVLWDEPNHKWRPNRFLIWFIGALERHLNILI